MEHRTRIRIAAATTATVLVGLSAAGLATRGADTGRSSGPAVPPPSTAGIEPAASMTDRPTVVTVPDSVAVDSPIAVDDDRPGDGDGGEDEDD